MDGDLRRAKGCSVDRDATDKLGVVNCDHGRYDAADLNSDGELSLLDIDLSRETNEKIRLQTRG
jgi:hypothetical protein